jgi:hypothetical protein
MKKYLIGLFSFLLVLASVAGASSKGVHGRRPPRLPGGPDQAMWV